MQHITLSAMVLSYTMVKYVVTFRVPSSMFVAKISRAASRMCNNNNGCVGQLLTRLTLTSIIGLGELQG